MKKITFNKLIKYVVSVLSEHGLLMFIPDKPYLKFYYKLYMGKKLRLDPPVTYNEKLQWLKLYDRKPLYTVLCDKYRVRDYVKETIGEEHLIPLIGVWDRPEDIDPEKLPEQFVLKCNHDSGGVYICKDKSKFDFDSVKKALKKRLKVNYYWMGREWPYKNIERRIIAEKFMVDESGYELKDYKFFCFDGECKVLFIATDREEDARFDYFDRDFNHLSILRARPMADKPIAKPEGFEEMIKLAEKLSKGIPQVRVDLYNINGQIYFGELTFFHGGGKGPFKPEEWDYTFGSWIKLPEKD